MSWLKQKLQERGRGREAERIYRKERQLAYEQGKREAAYRESYGAGIKAHYKKGYKQGMKEGFKKGVKEGIRRARGKRR